VRAVRWAYNWGIGRIGRRALHKSKGAGCENQVWCRWSETIKQSGWSHSSWLFLWATQKEGAPKKPSFCQKLGFWASSPLLAPGCGMRGGHRAHLLGYEDGEGKG